MDVLGDEVQLISQDTSHSSVNEEVGDSARDYFYETFIMNGVTIGSAQYRESSMNSVRLSRTMRFRSTSSMFCVVL